MSRSVVGALLAAFSCLIATVACAKAPAAQQRISVQAQCVEGSEGNFMVLTILNVDYEFSGAHAKLHGKSTRHREIWNFSCRRNEEECSAVRVSLQSADKGESMGTFDITAVQGLRDMSRTGKVVTLQWGPLRTLTVDFAKGEVRYRESAEGTEGQGTGRCG